MSYRPALTMSKTPSGALCLLAESIRTLSRPSDIFSTRSAKFLVVSPKIGKLGPQVSARRSVNVSCAKACVAAKVVATVSTAADRTERILIVELASFVFVLIQGGYLAR